MIIKRTTFELHRAEKRAHILEGLQIAIAKLDETIIIIKKAKTLEDARRMLIGRFFLSEEQANAILDMRLSRLTSLERGKIGEEHDELTKTVARLKKILASEKEILGIIKEELRELKTKYGDERRTRIVERAVELDAEDLIADEEMAVTITHSGYIKRLPIDTFRMQRRGGKGIVGMETKEEDFVRDLFIASTHDFIMYFTNRGRVYWLKTYEIPQVGRHAKGKAIVNLLKLTPDENVNAAIPVREFDDKHYLFFATKKGVVKKTVLSAFSNPRTTGIIAISLDDNDELVDVKLTDGEQEIIIATRLGKAIRFHEKDVRDMGRAARGVRGIKLREKDEVIAMDVISAGKVLLSITEKGFGKRTPIDDYRATRRGGVGIINIKTAQKNGPAVDIIEVSEEDEIILTSSNGLVIREPVKQIPVHSRNTQGVKVMNLGDGDRVVAVAKVVENGE